MVDRIPGGRTETVAGGKSPVNVEQNTSNSFAKVKVRGESLDPTSSPEVIVSALRDNEVYADHQSSGSPRGIWLRNADADLKAILLVSLAKLKYIYQSDYNVCANNITSEITNEVLRKAINNFQNDNHIESVNNGDFFGINTFTELFKALGVDPSSTSVGAIDDTVVEYFRDTERRNFPMIYNENRGYPVSQCSQKFKDNLVSALSMLGYRGGVDHNGNWVRLDARNNASIVSTLRSFQLDKNIDPPTGSLFGRGTLKAIQEGLRSLKAEID